MSRLFTLIVACAPAKTAKWVRLVLEKEYRNDTWGISGNEDAGQMSAWYLFSALGFYPVAPGSGWYELGSPNLRSAAIQVGYGNTLRIETIGNATDKARVQSVTWNGETITDWRIASADLVKGGTLTYTFE